SVISDQETGERGTVTQSSQRTEHRGHRERQEKRERGKEGKRERGKEGKRERGIPHCAARRALRRRERKSRAAPLPPAAGRRDDGAGVLQGMVESLTPEGVSYR